MQHTITLTPLVVEERHLIWLAAQPNTTHNVQVAELNQAVKIENLVKAATNLVANSFQHICKKPNATYNHSNSFGFGGIRSQLACCTAQSAKCASSRTQLRLWKVRIWPRQPQT
jgi:hypothetical protein